MDENVASKVSFTKLCDLFEGILNVQSINDKQTAIKHFVKLYRKKANELKLQNQNIKESFYPALRLLLPQLERERGPYGIKEHTFRLIILKLLVIPKTSPDAILLKDYRTSKNSKIKDFSDAAYVVLKKRLTNVSKLSLLEVNNRLDQIAKHKLNNSPRLLEDEMLRLFQSTSSLEQKWIIRLILKDLKLGIGHENILKAFHKDAFNIFNNNNNLSDTCDLLSDPRSNLNNIDISIFNAFRPMLSLRCDAKQFKKSVIDDRIFLIENKFDGERFQLHMSDGNFKYFSRRAFDYTTHFGGNYHSGVYTKFLKNCFRNDVKSVILDGEMMVWNKAKKLFGSKGMNVDVKTLKEDNVHQACFCVFDILLLNNQILTKCPLKQRKEMLEAVVVPIEGVILVSEYLETSRRQDILDGLNFSVDKKEEGIVFKDPESIYLPNSRDGWWKMKLEYFEGVMSDLDVMIMGGYYGTGRQKNQVTEFLVGIVDKSDFDEKYLSFVKIATGLSNNELKFLDEILKSHWKKVNGKDHEKHNLFWGKESPDLWILPEKSCCLLVRGTELTKSYGSNPPYKAPYSLRFPRSVSLRTDKPINDCLSIDELNALTNNSSPIEKLNKRHLDLSDVEDQLPKKRSRKRLLPIETIEFEIRSDILENMEFLVLSGKENWTNVMIEKAILENSGKIVKAERNTTSCMLMGDTHLRLTTYKGEIDIVNVEWLRRVLNEGEYMPYNPHDVLYASPKTKMNFMKNYDKFGDSYCEKATEQSLRYIVDNVFNDNFEMMNYINLMPKEIIALNSEFNFTDNYKIFLGYNVYFDKHKIINDDTSKELRFNFMDEIDFVQKGGNVSNLLNVDCKFIVTDTENKERVSELKLYLKAIRNDKAKIVANPNDILIDVNLCDSGDNSDDFN